MLYLDFFNSMSNIGVKYMFVTGENSNPKFAKMADFGDLAYILWTKNSNFVLLHFFKIKLCRENVNIF